MVLKHIDNLIEKYERGETSLKEEKQLSAYFSSNTVAPHLLAYKPLFEYYALAKNDVYKRPITTKNKVNNYVKWVSVAAALLLGLGWYFNTPTKEQLGTYTNPDIAYAELKKSLQMVSKNFKKGTSKINYLNTIQQAGTQVGYLEEIENTTQLIFKK